MPVQLTNEQNAVVQHELPGHARVLAGPGTGKSTTAAALAERLLGLEEPPNLKFLTFTRAATLELDQKLENHGKAKPATVHSFSIATLLRNPGSAQFPQPLRIPDEYERNLIRTHLARLVGVQVYRLDDLVREMAARWESLDPAETPHVTAEERARFIGSYTEHRRTFGYTLLDELPDLFRCALRDHQDLVGVNYDLLIVDEYQDLNACELEILRRLADRGTSIVAIGDDDQSIYSFRKAHAEGIRRFTNDYLGAKDYILNICLRLPSRIAHWAQHIIAGDRNRAKPPIQCLPGARGGVAALLNFPSEITEARGIADLVTWLRDARHIPLSEILILSRTDRAGTFTRKIVDELRQRGIPVSDSESIDSAFNSRQNRTLLATMRLLVNRNDSLAWWTLLILEDRIGDVFISKIYQRSLAGGMTFGDALHVEAIHDFNGFPRASRQHGVAFYRRVVALLENVHMPVEFETLKWGEWIATEIAAGLLPGAGEDLLLLLRMIDESYTDSAEGLERFLSQLQPLSKDLARAQSDGVRFMTMVGSKGLTVRATIVVGVDNDLIPRPGQDISEERRLLYVAMTRSQEYLFLTWANRRQGPAGRAGHANPGRRTHSELLNSGPIESEDGQRFIRALQR